MRRSLSALLLAYLTVTALAAPCTAATEPYPYLYDEIEVGRAFREKFLYEHGLVQSGPEWETGQVAFARLTRTPGANSGPPFPYALSIYNGDEINAFSTFGGQVFVPSATARLLGTSEGLWAAVLSHEIGHCYARHAFRTALLEYRQAQAQANLRRQAAAGDSSAQMALVISRTLGTVINRKIDRNEEHEADEIGILLMVQAGYHPNWAVSMYRLMKARIGDQTKFEAFFSTHPRWETREERAAKMFDDAISAFEARWPDLESSPGGMPPPVAFIRGFHAQTDKAKRTVTLTAEYAVSDPRKSDVGAVVYFFNNKKTVRGAVSDYSDKNGNLFAAEDIPRHGTVDRGTVTLTVPAQALASDERKLEAVLVLVTANDVLDVSDPCKTEFPKP